MFAGKKSAQIREILINESAWEEMTCLFAPSLGKNASGIVFNQTAPPEEGAEEKTINSSRGRQHTDVYPALAGNTDTAMFH
ncbi:hypothetical protein EI036_22340 [Escherichia coli]|nr:hypothetical protein [Escherichia coli]